MVRRRTVGTVEVAAVAVGMEEVVAGETITIGPVVAGRTTTTGLVVDMAVEEVVVVVAEGGMTAAVAGPVEGVVEMRMEDAKCRILAPSWSKARDQV